MINKIGLLIVITALTNACSQHQPEQQQRETPECQAWHARMTAPMPPDVHNRLKADCEKSMKLDGSIRSD